MRSWWAADRTDFVRLTEGGRVRHQPGLDGLRGLAVAAVVVFHTGLGWLPGGYLGVSLFFTISGTVIGTVVLSEVERGGFSLRRFWDRRARRLFPAAWVLLTVVAVARVTSTTFSSTSSGDVVASWLHVANWHFLAADTSYAELFGGPSAVLHFWSLAIEEQFYLAVGAVAAVLARWSSRAAQHLAVGAAAMAAVSFALPSVLSFGVDRTYYGTDTRAGELLVGLAIAGVIADPDRRRRILAAGRAIAVLAVAALASAVVLWRILESDDVGLRTWVLPASALVSTTLVMGALVSGPVAVVTSWRPLRWLGGISYALYLVHWPVFVAVRRARPDAGAATLAAATALAVALAVGLTRLVETPVRARRVRRRWLGAGAATLVLATGLALARPAQRSDADVMLGELERVAAAATTAPGGAIGGDPRVKAPPTSAADGRPVVGVFGDSTALTLAMTLPAAADEAQFATGPAHVALGCGVALSPARGEEDVARCEAMVDDMAAVVRDARIDAALVVSCQWELVAQRLPGGSRSRAPGDPSFDAFVRDAYRDVARELREAGARVLWLRCPRPSTVVGTGGLPSDLRAARDPARTRVINGIVDDLAAVGVVEVVDLATWVNARVDDRSVRGDGVHYVYDTDSGVADELTRLLNDALAS